MIKLFILIGLFLSVKAFAGYQCELKLAHTEDLYKTIATRTIKASDDDMKSLAVKDFFIEKEAKKRMTSLMLKAFVSGWSGEEQLVIALFRRKEKKSDVNMVLISQKVSLRGNDRDTLWFDSYKLDIDCFLN